MERRAKVLGCEYTAVGAGKLFSRPEAERALVLVRRVAADAVAAYAYLLQTQRLLERIQRCGPIDEINRLQGEMAASAKRVQDCAGELESIGAELTDLAGGEVDFPGVVDGRLVCFCWQLGEEGISHWHDPAADLARRRPIEELPPAARPAAAPTGRSA
jgi:hypothetical protein